MCNSADSEISSQEDRSTFDKNYEPSSQSLMSGEMTESEANWRESTMADNEDGVLEDGEVESSNGEVEVNVEATTATAFKILIFCLLGSSSR